MQGENDTFYIGPPKKHSGFGLSHYTHKPLNSLLFYFLQISSNNIGPGQIIDWPDDQFS